MIDSSYQGRAHKFQIRVAMCGNGISITRARAARALKEAKNDSETISNADWTTRALRALALAENIEFSHDRREQVEIQALTRRARKEKGALKLDIGQPLQKKGFRHFIQGRLFWAVGDYQLAKSAFLNANRLIPGNEQIADGMFCCAFATGNRRQAMFWAGRLIELSPGRAKNWLKLAICWMANRVGFEARNAIERAMELDPGNSYYRRFWIECDDSDPDL